MKSYKECLKEWNLGNIFLRRKEGGAMMTGSSGGGGGSPYLRISTGSKLKGMGGSVRYSSGGSRSGKNVIYQTMSQKMGHGFFRRSRNVIPTGTPKITKIKMYKTPKFK